MIKSIFYSQKIIPKEVVNEVISTVTVPDVRKLGEKCLEEIRNLTIIQVQWHYHATLGFTLNDAQSCKAGSYNFDECYSFDPAKKITRIEVIIAANEYEIYRTSFYSDEETLAQVGFPDEDYVVKNGGRVEIFKIADDEKLIGC